MISSLYQSSLSFELRYFGHFEHLNQNIYIHDSYNFDNRFSKKAISIISLLYIKVPFLLNSDILDILCTLIKIFIFMIPTILIIDFQRKPLASCHEEI